jgi:hypothetical protein
MGIIYRHQKKEPLTIEEMDGNFAHLEARVKNLEAKPPLAEGIAAISQEGDQLTILGTFGTVLGKVTLPKAIPNLRGKWQPKTAYRVLDWVQVKQGLYSCMTPHTSTEFEADERNWVLVFES